MRNVIYFFVFIAALIGVVALNIFEFWGIAIFFTFGVLVVVFATIYIPQTRSIIGGVFGYIGSNNNYRYLVMILLTLTCFIFAIKYGPGEPLAKTAFNDVSESIKFTQNEDFQKNKNYLLWGEKKTDTEMNANKMVAVSETSPPRTWFFWKMTLVFFLLTLAYTPFAFADEVAEILLTLIDWLKIKSSALKQSPVVVEAVKTAVKAKVEGDAGSRVSWFGKLYSSGIAMDFAVRLLQNFTKLFTR